MSLILYQHAVLLLSQGPDRLYENDTPFERRMVWPAGKTPWLPSQAALSSW